METLDALFEPPTMGSGVSIDSLLEILCYTIDALPLDQKVDALNKCRSQLHRISPFRAEPVDCVLWVKNTRVTANDYNPNSVAPPEMKLLEHSIDSDGYTQPIVTWPREDGMIEVVDGFHRHRVGKESPVVGKRVKGYLPTVAIKSDRTDINDRMAATIRHNRARGKHSVNSMMDIVIELKKRNWSDDRVAKELGMEADEVLRLTQISGIAEMFNDSEFSMSWDIDDIDSCEESDEEGV